MEKKIKELKQAIIISAFAGCGKTYAFEHYQDTYTILDSDSSQFSWVKDSKGNSTPIRDPNFPANYIKHIKDNLTKADFIFVSSHQAIRRALAMNSLEYYAIFPYNTDANKKDWLDRFTQRGSTPQFCETIMNNWDNFIGDMEIDMYPFHIRLGVCEEGIEFPKYINLRMLEDIVAFHKDWISQPHDYVDMRNIKDMV